MSLVDAKTGQISWGHNEPTIHIHSSASAPTSTPVSRLRVLQRRAATSKTSVGATRRAMSCQPRIRRPGPTGRSIGTPICSASCSSDQVHDYGSEEPLTRIEGSMVAVVDLLGDWREEIITSVPGELRIYVTTIPAASV